MGSFFIKHFAKVILKLKNQIFENDKIALARILHVYYSYFFDFCPYYVEY